MTPFRFCPACGSPLHDSGDASERHCSSCDKSWYDNPAPTVGCVLVRDGRALVTVRNHAPFKGRIDVPGGFIDPGEALLDALRREVREELGVEIDVSDDDFVQGAPHRYGAEGNWTLALGFKARITSGEPDASDDVADIKWVSDDELDDLDFAWDHDRELVRRVLTDG